MDECKESVQVVEDIYAIYKNDAYMRKYIHTYFTTQLKPMLSNMQNMHTHRQTHIQEMGQEQENFIHTFLNTHKYYYVPQTDKFFLYDEIHYTAISEDDVLHHILTEISKDKKLIAWKQRTKVSLLKRIKENLLFRTIPNSETIQHILDLFCPLLFKTKTEVKYFLSILGDNLLKKNSDLIHFISPKAKLFLREINNFAQIFIGTNAIQTFKHKYHEHAYTKCRLIQINDIIHNDALWAHMIPYTLDILAVCCHYSARYGNADEFIRAKNNDKEVENFVLFLHNHSQESIIAMFIAEYMIPVGKNEEIVNEISWKTMQYLWKQFLDARKLPAIIFQSNLKQCLIHKWEAMENTSYDELSEKFIGMEVKYVPYVQPFLQFWKDCMVYDANEADLELDEIVMLFHKHMENRDHCFITEKEVLDLILFFVPNVEIENKKYVHKYRCLLWDKTMDITTTMTAIFAEHGQGSLLSIYDGYEKYCQKKYEQQQPSVSKQYFEKFVSECDWIQ